MHFVRHAEHAGDHRLFLTFETGETRLANLAPHLDGEVFEPLRSADYFRRFYVDPDLDTVVWPNGADFSPDFLFDISQPVTDASAAADR